MSESDSFTKLVVFFTLVICVSGLAGCGWLLLS
jgi:hypothetical protein